VVRSILEQDPYTIKYFQVCFFEIEIEIRTIHDIQQFRFGSLTQ